MSASSGHTNTTGIQSDIPPNSSFGGAEIVMTATNFYALKVRFELKLMSIYVSKSFYLMFTVESLS